MRYLPSTSMSDPSHEISVDESQKCSNCGTSKTPLWRRAPDGNIICNACGLYYKANHSMRPVNLKRPLHIVTLTAKELEGKCSGDGHCNGLGGGAGCDSCPSRLAVVGSDPVNTMPTPDVSVSNTDTPDPTPEVSSPSDTEKKVEKMSERTSQAVAVALDAIACSNCGTTVTPLWRRDSNGDNICNACGLYYKLHGFHRPVKLKKQVIKRRKRKDKSEAATKKQKVEVKPERPILPVVTQIPTPITTQSPPNGPTLPPLVASAPFMPPYPMQPYHNGLNTLFSAMEVLNREQEMKDRRTESKISVNSLLNE